MIDGWLTRVRAALWAPVDIASLAAFRILFGVLTLVSTLRYFWFGWLQDFFVAPHFFFKYAGAAFVAPWPAWAMKLHLAALAVLSLLIALGLFYRVAIILFLVGFTFVQLIDVTNYLNHYYLVALLALLLAFLPAHRAWSLDAWRDPKLRVSHIPAWYTYLLRFQIGVVYVFAGLAKLTSDWLLHAQPLSIWLSSRAELPLVGPILGQRWAWYAFSWAGFLFDTTVVFFLLARRTRPYAYAVVLAFHTLTQILFPIGMFPALMVTGALVYFSPSWPRRLLAFVRRRGIEPTMAPVAPRVSPWARRLFPVVCAYAVIQVLLPLRHHLYGGNVHWHEQGMRFAWNVMVREKQGSVTYIVSSARAGRTWHVPPTRYLNHLQASEMSSQPDLILQLAHHIARDFRARGYDDVVVRVDALASLNGRPAAPLIDPSVDLARVKDQVTKASWILPAPPTTPLRLDPV